MTCKRARIKLSKAKLRLICVTSNAVAKPLRARSSQLLPKWAALATHKTTCRSRRPPGDSLQFGSSAYGVLSNLLWRWRISSVLATKKALGSRLAVKTSVKRPYKSLLPTIKRDSSKLVCTVTSFSACATQSATVRTDEPISKPTSQQLLMKSSIRWRSRGWASKTSLLAASGRSNNTSTSECGNNSARP